VNGERRLATINSCEGSRTRFEKSLKILHTFIHEKYEGSCRRARSGDNPPKRLRERLGVKPGTVLEFSEEHGRLIAVKSGGADPISEVYGCLGKKIDTDATMARLRGRQ
jgi:hypothetical protein